MSDRIIPLTPGQLPALLDLCGVSLPLDPFSVRLLRTRIFEDPRFDGELSLAIEDTGKLIAVAVGVVRAVAEGPPHGWIKLLAVHPDHRRQGLAKALLAELEQRFRQRQVPQLDTVGAPHYLWPGIDVRYTPACCLFEKLGFSEHRYTVNMAVDLAGQNFDTQANEQRLSTDGFAFHRSDPAAFDDILAFIGKDWPVWCDEVRIAMANHPVTLYHATQGDRVVAFAAYDTAMFKGTFGPMGTDASLRGKGVGAVLLKRCLRDMKDRGCPRCEIAWVGPVGFYARQVNACINRVFRDYRKTL